MHLERYYQMRHRGLLFLLLVPMMAWGQFVGEPIATVSKNGTIVYGRADCGRKNIYPEYHNQWGRYIGARRCVPPAYIVVSRPQFREVLQPLVGWKRQQGFDVAELYFDTNDRDAIRDSLRIRYWQYTDYSRPPIYLLIVGDVSHIKAFDGNHRPSSELGNYVTDLYYGEYTGDYFPEAIVGRLSATDTAELQDIIAKTLAYEQQQEDDEQRANRVLVVAGQESRWPAPTTTNGQVHYVGHSVKALDNGIDTFCFSNPSSATELDSITQIIRGGTNLVYYTAHGTVNGWSMPNYTSSIVDTLGDQVPSVYINNCCLTNDFAHDCLGEHLLRKRTGGAVGVIGATNSSLWDEDYYWSVGAKYPFSPQPAYDPTKLGNIDRMLHTHNEPFDQQAADMGQLLLAGNYAVTQLGSPCDAYYWEIYNLLGDPTLIPHIATPKSNPLTIPDSLTQGTTSLHLSAAPYSFVAAIQDGTTIGCVVTDGEGQGDLFLSSPLADGPVLFSATAQGHFSRTDTVECIAPSGGVLSTVGHNVTPYQITAIVKNIGDRRCSGHTITVAQGPDDTIAGAIISPRPSLSLGTLMPGEVDTVCIPIEYTAGTIPYLSAHIDIADSLHTYQQLQIGLDLDEGRPELVSLGLYDNGSPVRQIVNSHAYQAVAIFHNGGSDTATVVLSQDHSAAHLVPPLCNDTLAIDCHTGDTATHLMIQTCITIGSHTDLQNHFFNIGHSFESFEEGSFSHFPWDTNTTVSQWRTDATTAHHGQFSAQSGPIGPRQRSDLALDITTLTDDTLSFWVKISSEDTYDKLSFYIDGQLRQSWSGIWSWREARHAVEAGTHKLLWRYSKDDNGNGGSDCAWIDDIVFPLGRWDKAYGSHDTTPVAIEIPSPTPFGLLIFPNPAQDYFSLDKGLADIESITIHNMYGRKVSEFTRPRSRYPIGLAPGIYIVTIHTRHTTIAQKMVVHNR